MKAIEAEDVEGFIRIMKRPVSFWEIKIAFEGRVSIRALYSQLRSEISHDRIVVKKVEVGNSHVNFFYINDLVDNL